MRQGLSRLPLALVLIAFCFPLFLGLGAFDLDNDEAIYSYAVESIVTTGEWLAPRSSPSPDEIFLEKPHLKLWMVAAPIQIGLLPLDEFGLRFWDAVFGAASFIYVFLIGRRLAGQLCGALATLVLFAHGPLIFDHGFRSNNMDAALVLAYGGGVYHYLQWASTPGRASRMLHIAAVLAWFYLGFMSKFVAAIFLPVVLAVCVAAIRPHRIRLIEDRRPWTVAIAVTTAAIIPWFAYQHLRHGGAFWHVLLGEHVVTRFTTYVDPAHVRPWYFYFAEGYRQFARSGSAIWVGLGLLVLILDAWRRRTTDGLVVLAWAVLPTVAISFGNSKLYHYFYPFLPPFALAAGYGVASIVRMVQRRIPSPAAFRARRAALPAGLRVAGMVIVLGSAALLVATAVSGTLQIHLGDQLLFRNSSLLRPAIAGLLGAALLDVRAAAGGMLVLALSPFLPMPLAAYEENLGRLRDERRPLASLAECIRGVDASRGPDGAAAGPYAPVSDGYLHQYFFYLRGSGWVSPEVDPDVLRRALFAPGQERVVVIDGAAYAEFLEGAAHMGPPPAVVLHQQALFLLPGAYRECGRRQVPVGR